MNTLEEIQKALQLLGLNSNAIKFYLASYAKGYTSVGKIAELIKIDRSSAYLALEQLENVGLVDEKKVGYKKLVCARPPQAIISRLRTQTKKFKNQCLAIEDQLPELLAEYSQKDNQPVLQFFSGKDGLKQITDDILDYCQDELLVFSNQQEEKRVFTNLDHKEFIRERMKKNIRIRVLTPDTPEAHALKNSDNLSLRETRIIHEKDIPFTNEIYIYRDKIAMLEFAQDTQGFIVKSKAFAEAQAWIFEKLWKMYE
jgi:sugar-specific transcriptional regulator TrmB